MMKHNPRLTLNHSYCENCIKDITNTTFHISPKPRTQSNSFARYIGCNLSNPLLPSVTILSSVTTSEKLKGTQLCL